MHPEALRWEGYRLESVAGDVGGSSEGAKACEGGQDEQAQGFEGSGHGSVNRGSWEPTERPRWVDLFGRFPDLDEGGEAVTEGHPL